MTTGICSVDGCDRPLHGLLYCDPHYRRWRRTGNPGSVKTVMERRGTCTLDGCDRPHLGHGYCQAHYDRWKRHGDPTAGRSIDHAFSLSYGMAHDRVRTERGLATDYACEHCAATAAEWAYDHEDPGELTDPANGPYSADLARYMPLCHPCHRKFDHPIDRDRCAQLYRDGMSSVAIARELGCAPTTVIRAARAAGIEIRERLAWRADR